jgi:hypothetical protein
MLAVRGLGQTDRQIEERRKEELRAWRMKALERWAATAPQSRTLKQGVENLIHGHARPPLLGNPEYIRHNYEKGRSDL